jgi:hypothetical protein
MTSRGIHFWHGLGLDTIHMYQGRQEGLGKNGYDNGDHLQMTFVFLFAIAE